MEQALILDFKLVKNGVLNTNRYNNKDNNNNNNNNNDDNDDNRNKQTKLPQNKSPVGSHIAFGEDPGIKPCSFEYSLLCSLTAYVIAQQSTNLIKS